MHTPSSERSALSILSLLVKMSSSVAFCGGHTRTIVCLRVRRQRERRHEGTRSAREDLLDLEVVALDVVHRGYDLQTRLVVHAKLRLTHSSLPHVQRFSHGVAADVVARLQNRVAHHRTTDGVEPRSADILHLTPPPIAHATAQASQRHDRRQRVCAVVERVGVQHVAVVLLRETVRPLALRPPHIAYSVDPELDEDGASHRAHADRVEKEVVLRVVHETGVSDGSHFCGSGAGLQNGGIDHGRMNHRHEQFVRVDEYSSCGADENAADGQARQLGVSTGERENRFDLAVTEYPFLVRRSSAYADASQGDKIHNHGRERMGSIGDD